MKTDQQFQAAILRLTMAAEAAWIVWALLMVLLLTGCKTYEKQTQVREMFLPPMPSAARSREAVQTEWADEGHAIAPAKVLTLLWEKNDLHPETVTQVWQSGGLVNWTLLGEFSEPRAEIIADKAQQFYKIRNRLGNELSEWARK
jgi:hypothetical protein